MNKTLFFALGFCIASTDHSQNANLGTAGNTIEVFPPDFTLGYIVLYRQPADSGVRYTREHAEFRGSGELATLIIGNERYVDCVSNPAAAVWATVPRAPTGR